MSLMPSRQGLRVCRFFLGCLASIAATSAQALSCPGGQVIDVTLPTNSRWEMCWEQRIEEGVVFSNGHFTPPASIRRMVFKSLSVAAFTSPSMMVRSHSIWSQVRVWVGRINASKVR